MADRLALGIMARAPSDERGKTRLTAALGLGDGAALRRAILLDTLEATRAADGVDRVLVYTPADRRDEMAGLDADVAHLVPQRGVSLGDRLVHAFDDLFSRGYQGVALIGSDLPTLPSDHLAEGLAAVRRSRDAVVIGPAEDGGYYFIGLARPHPELFHGVPWSTADVFDITCRIAAASGVALVRLPAWYDVDSVSDLTRVLTGDQSTPTSRGGRHLRSWAAAYRPSVPAASRRDQLPLKRGDQ